MSDDELKAIRERAEKATPGPWFASPFGRAIWCAIPGTDGSAGNTMEVVSADAEIREADATFIEYARTDIPALLAEVETLKAENARLAFIVEMVRDWYECDKAQAAGDPYMVIPKGNAMIELMDRYEMYATDTERLDAYMRTEELVRQYKGRKQQAE